MIGVGDAGDAGLREVGLGGIEGQQHIAGRDEQMAVARSRQPFEIGEEQVEQRRICPGAAASAAA